MNVFVLSTGRCGSTTFVKACKHISNFTSGHETRLRMIGSERFQYPANHIESDNRLSWLLGRLDRTFGDQAVYVHLTRKREPVAKSYAQRWQGGIINAYRSGIMGGVSFYLPESGRLEVCRDYYETVNANIETFLKDKTRKLAFSLENAEQDFARFWNFIGAEGDFATAVAEWKKPYNASHNIPRKTLRTQVLKTFRAISHLPFLIRHALRGVFKI